MTTSHLTRCAECGEVFYSPIMFLDLCKDHEGLEPIEVER